MNTPKCLVIVEAPLMYTFCLGQFDDENVVSSYLLDSRISGRHMSTEPCKLVPNVQQNIRTPYVN